MDVFTTPHSDEYGTFDNLKDFDFDNWLKETLNRRLTEESKVISLDTDFSNIE